VIGPGTEGSAGVRTVGKLFSMIDRGPVAGEDLVTGGATTGGAGKAGSGGSGGGPSNDGGPMRCVASQCGGCIPFIQAPCCKSDNSCGCMYPFASCN